MDGTKFEDQCDQIWRNYPTLEKKSKGLRNFVLLDKIILLKMAKYCKKNLVGLCGSLRKALGPNLSKCKDIRPCIFITSDGLAQKYKEGFTWSDLK